MALARMAESPPAWMLKLITTGPGRSPFALRSPTYRMPAANQEDQPKLNWLSTRTGRMVTPGAAPPMAEAPDGDPGLRLDSAGACGNSPMCPPTPRLA